MENETWKPIERTLGQYSVSSFGRIKSNERKVTRSDNVTLSLREKVIKHAGDRTGYRRCELSGVGTVKVHREVATAFIPNPFNLPEVNHKDGNKANNSVGNLEWVDHKTNAIHAHQSGLVKHKTTYSQETVNKIISEYQKGSRLNGCNALSNRYGLNSSYIWRIVNGIKRQKIGE